jgi:hypothetical protein
MINRTRAGIVLFVLAQGLTGCGGSDSMSTPLAPSVVPQSPSQPPPQPAPPINAGVRGTVVDSADRRIAAALVEVVDGPRAGLSVRSGPNGEFTFAEPFNDMTVFRATHEGHIAATVSWRSGLPNQPWLLLMLGVVAPPASIAGNYTLTFIADSICAAALPADLRTRTYAATITDMSPPNYLAGTRFTIVASGAEFEAPFNWFSVGVAGDYLAFWLGDEHLKEKLAANTYFELSGSAVAITTSGASTISASFDGTFRYSATACASRNHQLILTRR